MNISGIQVAIIGLGISSVAGIIGIFNNFGISINPLYLLIIIVIGAIISLIGMYLQYIESETIRIKVEFERENQSDFFIFKIPYDLYRKKHPIISMVDSNYAFCWGFPSEIMNDGTIIFRTTDKGPFLDRYVLIK